MAEFFFWPICILYAYGLASLDISKQLVLVLLLITALLICSSGNWIIWFNLLQTQTFLSLQNPQCTISELTIVVFFSLSNHSFKFAD